MTLILEFHKETALLGKISTGFTSHYYTEWDNGLGTDKVTLFLLIHIQSQQIEAHEMGKEAFQLLQDHFLHQMERDPYDRFESALREVNHLFREKQALLDKIFLPNLHMIVGVIQGETVYLSQRGDAAAYLVRKRHTSVVTEDLYDPKNLEDAFQNIANGDLEVDDTLLLSTGNVAQYFTAHEFTQLFSEQGLASAFQFLQQDEELNLEMESQLALLGFDILEKHEEKIPSLVPEDVTPEKTEELLQPLSKWMGEEEEEFEAPVEKELKTALKAQMKQGMKQGVQQFDANGRKALEHLRSWAKIKNNWPFLEKFSSWSSKKQILVLLSLGIFVFGSIAGVYQYKSYQFAMNEKKDELSRAEAMVAQAELQGTFDKDGAREQLLQAEKLLLSLQEADYFEEERQALADQMEKVRLTLDGVLVVTEEDLVEVVDASSAFSSEEKALSLAKDDDQWVIFSASKAVPTLLDSLQSELDLEGSVVATTTFVDQNVLMLSTKEGKMIRYSKSNAQFADTADQTWPAFTALADFSNRLYGLDLEGNQIWRYTQGTDSFSGQAAYLSEDIDLTGASSMAIDGSVWLLFEDGRLMKFLSGKAVDFATQKAPIRSPKLATKLVLGTAFSQIYVLDSGRNTVYVYDKSSVSDTITYSAQFEFASLKSTIVDIVYDVDQSQLYLLTEEGVLYAWDPA